MHNAVIITRIQQRSQPSSKQTSKQARKLLLLLPRLFPFDVQASGSHKRRRLTQGHKVAVQLLPQAGLLWPRCEPSGCPGVGSPGVRAQCPLDLCDRGTSVSVLFSSCCTDVPSSKQASKQPKPNQTKKSDKTTQLSRKKVLEMCA